MYEYHGWVSLRATAEAIDDEPELRLAEIRRLVDEMGPYGLMDLRPLNGHYVVHMGGMPNHRGGRGPALIDLLTKIGQLAPGSYGLLHVWDDEHPEQMNEFRVFRLIRGVVTEHADPFLSPAIPTLEDPWVFDD
jgi:hypothetical protein